MAELLAPMNVRQMNLDDGHGNGGDRIAQSDAVVRESGGVQQDEVRTALGILHGIDERTLMIRLKELDCRARFCRTLPQHLVDVRKRRSPVDFRLTLSEKIEIRTVQHQNFRQDFSPRRFRLFNSESQNPAHPPFPAPP